MVQHDWNVVEYIYYVETSGASGYKVLDKETLPPKCSYCGNWFKDIYKACEHCGATWEGK